MAWKDKEEKREYDKRRYEANKAKQRARYKRYYEANKAARVEYVKRYLLNRNYGITLEVYNTLIDGQHFLCSICHKPDFADGRPLSVDHNHKTGWVRGLLCRNCNIGLGHFSDDPALLQRAIEYLHFYNREGKLPINQTQPSNQQGTTCQTNLDK